MSFKIYAPIGGHSIPSVPGQATILTKGAVRFHLNDIQKVRIINDATVLIDYDNNRIALRPPRDNDPSIKIRRSKRGINAWVNLRGAIQSLGIDVTKIKGDREILIKVPEQLLILCFTADEFLTRSL